MKKLLGIIVLGLLLCNASTADIIFKNCSHVLPVGHYKYIDGKLAPSITEEIIELKDDERREFYISFDESVIYKSRVFTRQWKQLADIDRVKNVKHTITFIDEKLILAKGKNFVDDNGNFTTDEIEINLENNEIRIHRKGETPLAKQFVELLKKMDGSGTEIFRCERENLEASGDTSGSSGTAFFVSNRGHLLTNNHVVEGCSISKITYENKDYDTKLLATDKTLDLALLKAEIRSNSFFTFSKNDVKKLNKVYVAGYPLGKGLSDDLKISSGIVSSLKGFEDNSNEIQIDAPINPGNSGGPIINENGDLIAIAVSGMSKDQTEGINFGIKSSAAETFLRSNKINPKKSMYAGIKDNDKLLEILEEATVYTYCN